MAILKADKHSNLAFQKYGNNSLVGILPQYDNHCSIVWSVPDDYCDYLQNITEKMFVKELNSYLKHDIKDKFFAKPPLFETLESKRLAFPLKTANLQ